MSDKNADLVFSEERVDFFCALLFDGGVDEEGYIVDRNMNRITNNLGEPLQKSDVVYSKPIKDLPFNIKNGTLRDTRDNPPRENLVDRLYPFSHEGTEGVLVDSEVDLIPLERYEE